MEGIVAKYSGMWNESPSIDNRSPLMNRFFISCCVLAGFLVLMGGRTASGHELSGYVEGEIRLFPHDPLYFGQQDQSASLAFQPEYYHEFESGSSFTFVPFFRLDSADSERTHFDVRELTYLWLHDDFELRLGVRKVFWGVTEVLHLVDIINQTDLVEDLDGEDKLGQPMINYNIEGAWGAWGLFVLPGFRERTFPGAHARLRGGLPIDADNATYDSAAEELHVDFAARWSAVVGDLDLGVSHFHGTSREPRFIAVIDGGRTVLRPHYDQIDQTALDAQLTIGPWLWKLEAMTRSGHGDRFAAGIGGLEYTFFQIAGRADLGLIAEISEDDRDSARAPAVLSDNDVFVGLRLTLNDDRDTTALAGLAVDRLTGETLMSIEAERRLSDNWKFEFEARLIWNTSPDGIAHGIRNDDYFTLRLARFF